MIPTAIQRGSARSGAKFPLPLLIAAAVAGVVALLAVWVLLTMGTPPAQMPVEQDLAVRV